MKAFVNEVYAALGRAIACSAFMFITVFCAVGEELSFALPESNDGLPGEGDQALRVVSESLGFAPCPVGGYCRS